MFKYSQDTFCLGISPKNVQVDSYTESIDLRVFFLKKHIEGMREEKEHSVNRKVS